MSNRSFYPDFLPKPKFYFFGQVIGEIYNLNLKAAIKIILGYTVRYLFPRVAGVLYYPVGKFTNRVFLRLSLDHFGPIIYVYFFLNTSQYRKDREYYILNCNFSNQYLLEAFPSNIHFVSKEFYWLILGGFFFCHSTSLHIFPIISDYKKIIKKINFSDLRVLSEDSRNLPRLKSLEKYKEVPDWLYSLTEGKPFLIIYNREPGWAFSTGESRRNIDLQIFHSFLGSCNILGIKVIRYGGDYMKSSIDSGISNRLLVDYTQSEYSSPQNDIYLWANCIGVIGSPSGATHVPSSIFGKPTLYIGFVPISHIIASHGLVYHQGSIAENVMYLLPNVQSKNHSKITLSDRLAYEKESKDPYNNLLIETYGLSQVNAAGILFISELIEIEEIRANSKKLQIDNSFDRYNIVSLLKDGDDRMSYDIIKMKNGNVLLSGSS